jgi:hypothetical protein
MFTPKRTRESPAFTLRSNSITHLAVTWICKELGLQNKVICFYPRRCGQKKKKTEIVYGVYYNHSYVLVAVNFEEVKKHRYTHI